MRYFSLSLNCGWIQNRWMANQLLLRQVVIRSYNSYRGKMWCTFYWQFPREPLCQTHGSTIESRRLKGSSATVYLDPNANRLLFFVMKLSCSFFIPPLLPCTKVTTKGPSTKTLLGERGGSTSSITNWSKVPLTLLSRFSRMQIPCPMEHMVQTLEGRSRIPHYISIIAASIAMSWVFGKPHSSIFSFDMCYSASFYLRQGMRPDPGFVFNVYFSLQAWCRHCCCRCCSSAASRIRVSGSFVFLFFSWYASSWCHIRFR